MFLLLSAPEVCVAAFREDAKAGFPLFRGFVNARKNGMASLKNLYQLFSVKKIISVPLKWDELNN